MHDALLVQPVSVTKETRPPTTRTLKISDMWELAQKGDLAGVKAAIEAGADLEAKKVSRYVE